MTFTWDPAKAARNIQINHISFETAAIAFDDKLADGGYDDEHSIDEDRYWQVGRVNEHFIFVVYTERNEDVIRLISARLATKGEIRHYYERTGGEEKTVMQRNAMLIAVFTYGIYKRTKYKDCYTRCQKCNPAQK